MTLVSCWLYRCLWAVLHYCTLYTVCKPRSFVKKFCPVFDDVGAGILSYCRVVRCRRRRCTYYHRRPVGGDVQQQRVTSVGGYSNTPRLLWTDESRLHGLYSAVTARSDTFGNWFRPACSRIVVGLSQRHHQSMFRFASSFMTRLMNVVVYAWKVTRLQN
jgi:hypothetical protein